MTSEYCFTECERVSSIIASFKNSFEQMYSDVRHSIVSTQYGIGGECMHMGFYCPSRIFDIVIGNINRGFAVNELGQRKASFKYGFDADKRLVSVEREHSKEFIVYDNAKVMSFCASDSGTFQVSECVLDANKRLLSYSVYSYLDFLQRVTEFTREIYNYGDDWFATDWHRFFAFDAHHPILEHDKFIFSKENGEFSSYTVEQYRNSELFPSIWDGRAFKIPPQKRKALRQMPGTEGWLRRK